MFTPLSHCNMKRLITLLLFISCIATSYAAPDTSKNIIWAFPITSYIVDLKPGVKVVQIKLPASIKLPRDKQVGLLRGVALGSNIDTGKKGYGKCNLIKGQYNYFSIFMDSAAKKPKQGDLIYALIPRQSIGFIGPITDCASHNISFLTVTDTAFYAPDDFLKKTYKGAGRRADLQNA